MAALASNAATNAAFNSLKDKGENTNDNSHNIEEAEVTHVEPPSNHAASIANNNEDVHVINVEHHVDPDPSPEPTPPPDPQPDPSPTSEPEPEPEPDPEPWPEPDMYGPNPEPDPWPDVNPEPEPLMYGGLPDVIIDPDPDPYSVEYGGPVEPDIYTNNIDETTGIDGMEDIDTSLA